MNIVIVNCFDTWEHRVDLLYKIMTETGHHVRTLQSDYRHFDKRRRLGQKRDYIFFLAQPYSRNMSIARLRSHIQLSRNIFGYVERHADSVDLLWVLAPPDSFVKDAASIKKRHPKVKLIIDLMDLWPETMPVGLLKKLPFFEEWKKLRNDGLKWADAVVTECDLYKSVLGMTVKGVKTRTLYLAREHQEYKPHLNLPDDKTALCYLGSINNIIDIDLIKKIIIRCRKKRPVLFHIIGDGEKKDRLIKTAKKAGAEVIYHGKIYDRSEKQRIFDSCHYGLNIMKHSVCVGLSMKSIDYFEFGLPVINNIRGDTWNAVRKYGAGINIDPKKIRLPVTLLADNPQRSSARSFFEKYLTNEVFADTCRKVLSECC